MSLRPSRLAGQSELPRSIGPRLTSSAVVVFAFVFAATLASAKDQSKTENYDNGKPHFVYSVDGQGRKNGDYRELSPEGQVLVAATYLKDQLNGPYKSLYPSGKPKIIAAYAAGKLSGKYREFNDAGDLAISATYKAGELNGQRQVTRGGGAVTNELWKDGKLVSAVGLKQKQLHGWRRQWAEDQIVTDEFWFEGKLLIRKGPLMIAQHLAAIRKMPVAMTGEFPNMPTSVETAARSSELQSQNEEAARTLAEYRFLCDVPFDDLRIDRDYMAHAQAGAQILTRVDELTHFPKNPGLPEDEYKFAYKGTSSSNCSGARETPSHSVHSYMYDSEDVNIDRCGHRRWCLNPAMLKVGFGMDDKYGCMWAIDSSRASIPDYDAVAFPPRGIVPTSHFKSGDYAWTISLNPNKFEPPDSSIKVSVTPVRFEPDNLVFERSSKPLEIGYFTVSDVTFGGSRCVIFRPTGVAVSTWSAYIVDVSGVKSKEGKEVPVQYFVAFYDPAQIKPPERTTPRPEP